MLAMRRCAAHSLYLRNRDQQIAWHSLSETGLKKNIPTFIGFFIPYHWTTVRDNWDVVAMAWEVPSTIPRWPLIHPWRDFQNCRALAPRDLSIHGMVFLLKICTEDLCVLISGKYSFRWLVIFKLVEMGQCIQFILMIYPLVNKHSYWTLQ